MNDWEHIQRLAQLGKIPYEYAQYIEELKQYHVIDAVRNIKGIDVNNAVGFVIRHELTGTNMDIFIKNVLNACKLFGSDVVTNMLSQYHGTGTYYNLYLVCNSIRYGKEYSWGVMQKLNGCDLIYDPDKRSYQVESKGCVIKDIAHININSRINRVALARITHEFDEKYAEMFIREDGSLEYVGMMGSDEYSARYPIFDTLEIHLAH